MRSSQNIRKNKVYKEGAKFVEALCGYNEIFFRYQIFASLSQIMFWQLNKPLNVYILY